MKRKQQGAHLVEFAVVAVAFFIVFFGVFEFARMLYVWNTLTEATRRGARVAAVCPVGHSGVADVTVFDNPKSPSGNSPVLPNLTTANVTVQYLDEDGTSLSGTIDPTVVYFVRVRIINYQHTLLIPFIGSLVDAPAFETTLPSESLGAVPTLPSAPSHAPECYETTS